jgi:hypothetical protein
VRRRIKILGPQISIKDGHKRRHTLTKKGHYDLSTPENISITTGAFKKQLLQITTPTLQYGNLQKGAQDWELFSGFPR